MEKRTRKTVCFQPLGKKAGEDTKFCDINNYHTAGLSDGIDEEAMALARKIGKFRGNNGTFQEMLTYEEHFNLFEFVKFEFVYEFLENVMWKVRLVKQAIKTEKPDEIIIKGNKNLFEEIVRSVALSEGVKITVLVSKGSFEDLKNRTINFLKRSVIGFLRRVRRNKRMYLGKIMMTLEKKAHKSKTKALFVLYSRNHVSTVMPLIKGLERSGKEIKVVALNVGKDQKKMEKLIEEKQQFTNLEAYITRDVSKRTKEAKKTFSQMWTSLKEDSRFRAQFVYDNISLWEISKDKLDYFFSTHLVDVVTYIETMKLVCDIEKPSIIIISEPGVIPIGRAAITVGNLKGIHTLSIQQGFMPDHPLFESMSAQEPNVPADKMTVYGDFTKRVFVKRGCNPEKIIVTGDPRLDNLARAGELYSREKVCNLLGIDSEKRILLLATNPLEKKDNEAILTGVFNAMRDIPNALLIVKPHPAEDESFHRGIAKKMGMNDVIITKDIDIHALLFACDVLLVVHSTVALEAMRLGKPVISINLTNIVDHINYAGSGTVIGVSKQEDIAPAITKILEDKTAKNELIERARNYTYDHLYKNDGLATKRVVEIIEEMIG